MAFESFVSKFLDVIKIDRFINYIIQFIIGIPVAFYLYGLIYGDVKGRYDSAITKTSVDNAAEAVKIAPKMTIYSAVTSFNIIYLAFFAVQAAYLFSALNGHLPEAFTYAEYARRGFFELCAITGINLGILAVAHLTIKAYPGDKKRALRIQTVIISIFTILLIVTALSKMAMYIDVYGLTQWRVFTSWFMILLLFVFVIISIRQIKKFNAARLIIIGFTLMFMVLSYGNADGLIAKYNISRYEAGTLATLDIEALSELSDAAAPYIYDLYLKTDESDQEMRQGLVEAIKSGEREVYTMMGIREFGFRDFNLQRYMADRIRGKM
jgi:hypothetical protein